VNADSFEAVLGHTFSNRELLARALTHKSCAFEKNVRSQQNVVDNEQLEFLGDSVLGFIVSECLVSRYPDFPEGRLSKLKARLVSATHLYAVAQEIGLGHQLRLGRGEEMSGGREKKALLADALEAIIAALYLDGGICCARAFVMARVIGDALPAETGPEEVTDFKSALQEIAQALKLPQPRYYIVEERGPEHAKTFAVEVRLGKELKGRAEGFSKKAAGQGAAEIVLKEISDRARSNV
jgi:ribonuclease-3